MAKLNDETGGNMNVNSEMISEENPETEMREDSPLLPRENPSIDFSRRWKLYYACFLFLGLGTLLPWNFFITADSYWQFKLRNISSNETTQLQLLYTPMLVSLSQITNFSFLFINALFSHMIAHKKRVFFSVSLMIFFFIITTIMTKIDSNDWQLAFFIATMVIIVGISASGAVFQGGLMGVAGMFPETYMCAVTGGQSLGGVFASLARIISLSNGTTSVTSAFIYFLIAVFVMILTLSVYIYISSTSFFKHYYIGRRRIMEDSLAKTSAVSFLREHLSIFKQIWPLGLSICFVLLVTLAVFPVVVVRVKSVYDNDWTNVYFQPVFTFLLYNVGDYVGRHISGLTMWPRRGSKLIYIFTLLRVVFIPLFLLCNHSPQSPIPSIFNHDAWYIFFMVLFSLSNGYLFSICMMYAPRMVSEEYAEKAGTMMAAMIGLGLLLGAGMAFSFALIS